MKKNPFTMHVNMDDFIPATGEEKEYMVQMRPSTTFFKDGVKRLLKNKIATISFILIVLITLTSIFLPMFFCAVNSNLQHKIKNRPRRLTGSV